MSAASNVEEVAPRPPRRPKGPVTKRRSSSRKSKGAASPAVPAGWTEGLLAAYCERFVRPGGTVVAGKVEPSGKTAWAPIYEGKRRVRASRELVARFLEGAWSDPGRLAVQSPKRCRDLQLDLDCHGGTPEERQSQLEQAWKVVDRLAGLRPRLRLTVVTTPRGLRAIVPVEEIDGVWLRNAATRLFSNQRLVPANGTADCVRSGSEGLTALPFQAGACVVYRSGAGRVFEPIITPADTAKAFERHARLRPVPIATLELLSIQPRRSPGRPRKGPTGVQQSPVQDGDQRPQGASKATTEGPSYSFNSASAMGEGQQPGNDYLAFPSPGSPRERIAQLVADAGLTSEGGIGGRPENSARSDAQLAAAASAVHPGALEPGSRQAAVLRLVHGLISAGLDDAQVLRAAWLWLAAQPEGASVDFDRRRAWTLRDTARCVVDRRAWRSAHPGSPAPRLTVDPRDVAAFEARGCRPAMARHCARVLAALRDRHRVGDELPVSRKWLGILTGVVKNETLAKVRAALVDAGILEMTASPDRRRGVATVCKVKALRVGAQPNLVFFRIPAPAMPIAADVYDPRRQAEAAVALDEAFRRLQNALRLPLAA